MVDEGKIRIGMTIGGQRFRITLTRMGSIGDVEADLVVGCPLSHEGVGEPGQDPGIIAEPGLIRHHDGNRSGRKMPWQKRRELPVKGFPADPPLRFADKEDVGMVRDATCQGLFSVAQIKQHGMYQDQGPDRSVRGYAPPASAERLGR